MGLAGLGPPEELPMLLVRASFGNLEYLHLGVSETLGYIGLLTGFGCSGFDFGTRAPDSRDFGCAGGGRRAARASLFKINYIKDAI